MGPFFSQLPLSCEKAGTMEWGSQSELRLPAPTTVGKGGPERAQHSTYHPVGLGIDLCPAPPQALASTGLPSDAWKVYGASGGSGSEERQGMQGQVRRGQAPGPGLPQAWPGSSSSHLS